MEFNATFIIAFISFIVFTVIMNIILYKPINDIVQKRKDFIDANYNEAKSNADKTRTILDERKNKLASARQNAKERSEEKINSAKNKKDEITSKAKQSAKENIEKAITGTTGTTSQTQNANSSSKYNVVVGTWRERFEERKAIGAVDPEGEYIPAGTTYTMTTQQIDYQSMRRGKTIPLDEL